LSYFNRGGTDDCESFIFIRRSSAYRESLHSFVPNLIPAMEVLKWMAMANASIASAKSKGELGQPFLHHLDNEKVIEYHLLKY